MTGLALDEVLAALDPEQHAVATAPRGPLCVLAGAGTGKTRALTHRIAALVVAGQVDPRHVLALTFTARAAGELRGRLRTLGVDGVQARTIHAAALRQLRFFWPTVVGGAAPDVAGSKAPLVAEAASRMRVRPENVLVRDLASEIEWAKVCEVAPDAYPDRAAAAGRPAPGELDHAVVGRIYAAYEAVKSDRGVIDFEDVLLLTAAMIADAAPMATTVRDQYRCLLVDEYQDVSPAQQRLLDLWLGDRDDITVVGDANQTIYSFAGASAEFLLGFAQRFPAATVLKLQRSYRSTPQVVETANRVLEPASGNARNGRVVLRSQRTTGPAPEWIAAPNEIAEVTAVTERVAELLRAGTDPRDIAVLYRINAQSAAYEEALTEAGIRYTVRGGERFFERREVRDALTVLRGASRAGDMDDETELVDQVGAALGALGYGPTPPPGPGQARDRWESWAALVGVARELSASGPATVGDLVDELSHRAATQHAPAGDGVTLASLHSAKGLEWDTVFLVGLADGVVPISYATTAEQVEEERRLLYVGITRARTRLVFSYARARSAGDRRRRQPCRFLRPLGGPFFEDADAAGRRVEGGKRPASCRGCGRALTTATERKLRHCERCEVDIDLELFESLRAWRKRTADELAVPAFVVFTDATLTAVAMEHPTTEAALRGIPGIGQVKVERYGAALLDVVQQHVTPTSRHAAR